MQTSSFKGEKTIVLCVTSRDSKVPRKLKSPVVLTLQRAAPPAKQPQVMTELIGPGAQQEKSHVCPASSSSQNGCLEETLVFWGV